ncbi:MAG: ABC transporter ATP-binding protein [Acidimicrobiia bacterium]
MSNVAFANVSVKFGTVEVASGITFDVQDGEWVSVVGPNGAGKTTLLQTLVGAVAPDGGSVTIDGQTVLAMHERNRARAVAYVPQRPVFPAGMAVFDYVLLGRTPHMGTLASESADDVALVWDALSALHLGSFAGRNLSTLSGGEVQRVALARVVAQQAPVLVLDEATASLDLAAQHEVLEMIDGLRSSRRMTVVSAIHDLTAAAQFSDKVALLAEGELCGFGTPSDVLTERILQEVLESEVRVLDVDGNPVIVSLRSKESAE